MYISLMGTCQQGSGPGPLAGARITDGSVPFTEVLEVAIPGGGAFTTNVGEIDVSVLATGGSGSYTYSWTVQEIDDANNVFSVASTGTTNAARYQTLTLNGTANDPPENGIYGLRCTINDGSSTVAVDFQVDVVGIAV